MTGLQGFGLRNGATGFQGMRPNIYLYCVDQEWGIQVIKGYFIYYRPARMDQGTMAKRGNRRKGIEYCGDRGYWLI